MNSPLSSIVILGTGSYLPERIVTNDDMAQIVETSDEWIQARTGIRQRRFAAEGENTSHMASAAARRAIEDAGIDPTEIDLILVATMTPDMPFPSTACLVQSQLGLPQCTAFDIQAACTGYVYGLNIATSMLQSGNYNKALVVGAEKLSGILDFEDRSTCVLFGDGAGAAVLGCSDVSGVGMIGGIGGADGSNPEILCQPAGGSAIPPGTDSLAARQHFLKMNGKEIFKQAVRVMGQASTDLLEKTAVDADDLALIIPHQANLRIIDSLTKRLGIPVDNVFINLQDYGNTSAASVGIALDEARHSGRIKTGDLTLLVAFGAGLTWGATMVKW
ncbi:MAG: 3-oxoacyl-[acyl-carrier-protein] synthase 3 [Opitutia bacterium UBA7350]|nr:MAG: 3-oxoacyl-[acyl-carrier-protein] synthase 3 [Opitutae bacterium UBA7350]